MTFHTDVDTGDMLSMFLQSVPLEGGDQFLASMASVYNDLMSHNPEALKRLSENWYWERSHRQVFPLSPISLQYFMVRSRYELTPHTSLIRS
jgi:hypothetical protein